MKKIFSGSLLLLGLLGTSYAQTSNGNAQNLSLKARHDAEEVFQNCMQYAAPSELPVYEEYLSRITIESRPYTSGEAYIPLSTVLFKNKCNPSLTRDNAQNFNPQQFNAFKYFLDFEPKAEKVYRVDQTSYVIVIHPKP